MDKRAEEAKLREAEAEGKLEKRDPRTKRERRQEPLDETADAIMAVVSRSEVKGFTGIKLRRRSLLLYWCGDVSAPIEAAVQTARDRGVHVEIQSAPFSHEQLKRTADEIVADAAANEVLFSTMMMHTDGTGITITAPGPLDEVRNLSAIRHSHVPVTVESGPMPVPSELDDASPRRRTHQRPHRHFSKQRPGWPTPPGS